MDNNIRKVCPLYKKVQIPCFERLVAFLADKPDLIVFHSSELSAGFGRYTFVGFNAFSSFTAKNNQFFLNDHKLAITDPFAFLAQQLALYAVEKNPDLPDFQCGMAGYFGYEAAHYLEQLPKLADNIHLPDMHVNFYHTVIAQDNITGTHWIIATGFPEKHNKKRIEQAEQDISTVENMIYQSQKHSTINLAKISTQAITVNVSQQQYQQSVKLAQTHILNGDIFEVNLSQQFKTQRPDKYAVASLYFKLMALNPAPFSALITLPHYGYIISASPERFVKLTGDKVETCPIKGTTKRSTDPDIDAQLAQTLVNDEKNRAENIMIVDLMRNDLSRVCEPHSVVVTALCALKSFATVHHLVSTITATLKPGLLALDLIKATFPAGSITGAPKIKAMEIISHIEAQTRGPYCGSMGYISFTGDMDTAVIIRSYYLNEHHIFYNAGGAITLESDPEQEYQESLLKAEQLFKVLT